MTDLESLRADVREKDAKIMKLIGERLRITDEIGRYKAEAGLTVKDADAESKVIARYRQYAEENDLDLDFAERLARILIAEAVLREEEICKKK